MSVFAIGAAAVAVGTTAYGMVASANAASDAADVDKATAAYNARVDKSQAEQIDLDTIQNIDTDRANNKVYLSRQATSYASSGVLANSGSALNAQVITAGKMQQQIQQKWVDSQAKQNTLYAQGAVGIAGGDARASADEAAGTAAVVAGAGKIAGTVFGAYESGTFSSLGSTGSKVSIPAGSAVTAGGGNEGGPSVGSYA